MTPEQREWLSRPTLWPPALRDVEGTCKRDFAEEYRVSLPPPHFPLRIIMPVGWRYDRGSVPSIVPPFLMTRDHLGSVAPGPHDAGFRCRGQFPRVPPPKVPYIVNERGVVVPLKVTRAEVDMWLLLYLLRQRVPAWRAYSAYYAVRGWWGFREATGLSKRW